jgi:predicted NAD/FAD-dependent oxidoreductase
MKTHSDVLVIGAGVAGLLAARELTRAGADVIVIDKGRGVGGRMATRRHGNLTFDHGAQFITVRDPRFAALMEELAAAGAAAIWFSGAPGGDGEEGHPRYRGVPGMTGIPKHLAHRLDVRLGVRALNVSRDRDDWRVVAEAGRLYRAKRVILTPPLPQTLALLDAGGVPLDATMRRQLAAVAYDPCLALLVRPSEPVAAGPTGCLRHHGEVVEWVADNQAKCVSEAGPALTVHCTPAFSREFYERADEEVVRAVGSELAAIPGFREAVTGWEGGEVKRWRYSRPQNPLNVRTLTDPELPGLFLAGDALAGARVEGAALSGFAATEAVLGAPNGTR